jgi:nucleoside-diphosphate-sugar epimerase
MSKLAFVTGGSGFIGRNLISALRQKGYAVRALARSDTAAKTVSDLGAEAARGDLTSEDYQIERLMAGAQVVFHAAAKVEDWGDPAEFQRLNVTGTEKMLHAAAAVGVARFVHVGSEAALVDGTPIHNADETRALPEHPIGLYPTTKNLAERAVLRANQMGKFETVVLRPRLVWGLGDTSLLPQIVDAVKRGAFRWFDGGRYLTSTCHVRNTCEGLICGAERGAGGQVYFLTDGKPIEFRTFMTRLLATQGVSMGDASLPLWLGKLIADGGEWAWKTFKLNGAPPLTSSAIRLIGEEVTVNDGKARREIGYVGHVTIDAGLNEMELAKP